MHPPARCNGFHADFWAWDRKGCRGCARAPQRVGRLPHYHVGLHSYASASSGTEEYDSASSGSCLMFFSAVGSSESSDYCSATLGRSFHNRGWMTILCTSVSCGQSTVYFTPLAGLSTLYYTAEGLPRSPLPSGSLPVPPTPPYPPLPLSPAALSSTPSILPVPRLPSLSPLPRFTERPRFPHSLKRLRLLELVLAP